MSTIMLAIRPGGPVGYKLAEGRRPKAVRPLGVVVTMRRGSLSSNALAAQFGWTEEWRFRWRLSLSSSLGRSRARLARGGTAIRAGRVPC